MDLAITGGTVVMPGHGLFKTNVYIRNGKIASVSDDIFFAKETVDATGRFVAPGIIDPHIHLGVHAPLEQDCQTETRAAIMGGVTTAGDFFGGKKPHSQSFPVIREAVNKYSLIDIVPHFVIGNPGQLAEVPMYIKDWGVKSFKVYFAGVPGIVDSMTDDFILDVMDALKASGEQCLLCAHCENSAIVDNAVKHMKERVPGTEMTLADWAASHPAIAEAEAIHRLATLAAFKEQPVYVVHLFTRMGVEALRRLKPFNRFVNVETTSPILSITCNHPQGNILKMVPPFQWKEDQDAIWEALADGIVETIGTDNTTTDSKEKNLAAADFWEVHPGIAALQWHLPAALTEGVINRGVPLERVIACMTMNPAKKLGIYPQKGSLYPGCDADVVVFDLQTRKTATAAHSESSSDFCIYEGREFGGWPVCTVKSGKIVMKDGELLGVPPMGQMLKR